MRGGGRRGEEEVGSHYRSVLVVRGADDSPSRDNVFLKAVHVVCVFVCVCLCIILSPVY